MSFEYDPDKSAENKRKHGIDFEEAQALGPTLRWWKFRRVSATSLGEWSSARSARNIENVRLISVRRSREREITIYESEDI